MSKGYCGTYTANQSQGIYSFELNEITGVLSNPNLFYEIENPKYLGYQGGFLFSLMEKDGQAGVCVLNNQGQLIDECIIEKTASCFLTIKDNNVYTANYNEGSFSVLSWKGNKLDLIFQDKIKEKAGCHQVLFVENLILVPCLLLDVVVVYNEDFEKVGLIPFAEGSGPRHGIYMKEESKLMILCELSNEVVIFDVNQGIFEEREIHSILPAEETYFKQSAALRVTTDEKFIIATTRGKNIFSILDKRGRLLQVASTGGDHPRDFVFSLNERFIVVANRGSNELVSYSFMNGKIGEEKSRISVPDGISIVWEEN